MNRREFLQATSAMAAASFAATPGVSLARVVGGPGPFADYKALVCVFLYGGNDSYNMLVPRSAAEHAVYRASRQNLAVATEDLLSIKPTTSDGTDYGLHPSMTALRGLFSEHRVGFVTNVGPLIEPVTKETFFNGSATLPPQLFSHNDQQDQLNPLCGGARSRTGWAGRMADLLREGVANQQRPAFLDIPADYGSVGAAITNAPVLATQFPPGQLGLQLETVAKLIAVHDDLDMQRQVFFVSMGGFDSHYNQNGVQPGLLGGISEAITAFYRATEELGVAEQVTTFTQSDFARTLTSNGDGTDHAWGGNQFVVGGAVKGGDLYGSYPLLAIGGGDDVGGGRMIPTTSADQYAATLARWFGIADMDLGVVAPHIDNFAVRDLGFMV